MPSRSEKSVRGSERAAVVLVLTLLIATCRPPEPQSSAGQSIPPLPEVVVICSGAGGVLSGPRAIEIIEDKLFVIDRSGSIKAFSLEGDFLHSWELRQCDLGTPTGIGSVARKTLLVADTHYSRILEYSTGGKLLREFGSYGMGPGKFIYVTDVASDSSGKIFVCEYGEEDSIQKFDARGLFLWRVAGSDEEARFRRPMGLAVDREGNIFVADSCNHRVVKLGAGGERLSEWGGLGKSAGELKYPYDVALDSRGSVYVCEYGNNRIQRFTPEGEHLSMWGRPGRGEGELAGPWAICLDGDDNLYIADTGNNRIVKVFAGHRR